MSPSCRSILPRTALPDTTNLQIPNPAGSAYTFQEAEMMKKDERHQQEQLRNFQPEISEQCVQQHFHLPV